MGVLAGVALLVFLAARMQILSSDALTAPQMSVAENVFLFLLGGALGGLIFGLLLPFSRHRAGATIIGMLVVAPFYALQGLLEGSTLTDGARPWWITAVVSVVVGGLAGYLIRDRLFSELDASTPSDEAGEMRV